FIIAQPQRPADVHQEELCPPNKCYALMDANKKINLDNLLYPNESKIMVNIIQNHPLRFNIAASSSVSWIYLGQFWHTLKEDESKYRLKFVLDRKEINMTLNDFRRIFYLPQATDNNLKRFVVAPKFSEMVPLFLNTLGFTPELRSPSNFKTTGLTINSTYTTNTPVPTTAEADDIILQDTIQLSLAEQKSRDELEAKKNVQKVEEHLIAEEIEKLVEGAENVENVEVDSSTLRQDDTQNILDTRLEPKSDKESSEVEITTEVQLVNINKEEEESAEDDYELKRRGKGKHVEESKSTPSPTTIRSHRTHSTLISSYIEKLQELTVTDPPPSSSTPLSSSPKLKLSATNRLLSLFKPKPRRFKRYKSFFDELQGRYGYLFEHLKTRFMPR
ncbi:hypothetical protein Tco_0715814, partial [Tanacetum coccineum]